MKLNKKTNKIILQKKDYEAQIIFLDGYIAINGNYIVKADLIELESDLIQDRINKNDYFSMLNGHETNFPTESTWKAILRIPEGAPVRVTNLFYKDEIKKAEYNLFTNLGNNQTIVMNADFAKIIKSLNGNVTQQSNRDFQPITVYKNNTLIGLFMPMGHRGILSDVHQFIVDNTEFKYEEEKAA